jgi:hypothetical protein
MGVGRDVLGNLGRNRLARAAPCREGVEDDDGVLGERLLELVEPGKGSMLVAAAQLKHRGGKSGPGEEGRGRRT